VFDAANPGPEPIRPGQPVRIALYAAVLFLLFGLGYEVSLRRRRPAGPSA